MKAAEQTEKLFSHSLFIGSACIVEQGLCNSLVSVCLCHQSTKAAAHSGFAAEHPADRIHRSTAAWRHRHTHTPVKRLFSRTTQVSWYQKGKTNLDFTEARDSEWQWNQLGHMQVCTSLQTDNHTSTPPLSFYRPDALPATQPTATKH